MRELFHTWKIFGLEEEKQDQIRPLDVIIELKYRAWPVARTWATVLLYVCVCGCVCIHSMSVTDICFWIANCRAEWDKKVAAPDQTKCPSIGITNGVASFPPSSLSETQMTYFWSVLIYDHLYLESVHRRRLIHAYIRSPPPAFCRLKPFALPCSSLNSKQTQVYITVSL